MKKPKISVLVIITCMLAAFTIGFFLGRNLYHGDIHLSVSTQTAGKAALPPSTAPVMEPASTETVPGLININTADALTFTTLPGIGEVLARRIVAYREANGPFSKVEELLYVEGIGEQKLESILDFITAGG